MGILGALWGVSGVLMLFGFAVVKLLTPAVDAFSYQFEWYHWILLAVNTAVVAYFKGYVAIGSRFTPRVAARARLLRDDPTIIRVLLAPFFCMGYFQATRKQQTVTFLMTVMMVGLIVLVRLLAQPVRGILDVGIALSLSWGFLSLLYYTARAFSGTEMEQVPLAG